MGGSLCMCRTYSLKVPGYKFGWEVRIKLALLKKESKDIAKRRCFIALCSITTSLDMIKEC
jgi:hypothetical protein